MFETIAALLLFLLPLAYSPGPGNMFFAAIGARFGTWASMPASAGYHVATWIVTFGIGWGFVGVLEAFPFAFKVMKYAGSAYMLWLALAFFRAGRTTDASEARPAGFLDGVVILMLNPKAYIIITLMFTQFLDPESADFVRLLLVITTVFTINNFIAFAAWTLLGDGLARLFATERDARLLNIAFGIMLVVVALWTVLR